MRTRLVAVLALVVALIAVSAVAGVFVASAGDLDFRSSPILAQDIGEDSEGDPVDDTDADERSEEQVDSEGSGQADPDTQSGADEEAQEGEGTEAVEEGPVWTYQMARIGLVLLALILLGVGLAYYRLVAQRQRAGV